MTDREIIENHLNRTYTFSPNHKVKGDIKYVQLKNAIKVYCNFDRILMSQTRLIESVTELFGNYVTDENLLVEQIVMEWFELNVAVAFNDIFDSLNDVEVVFGPRSWEVKQNGVDYDVNYLVEEHQDKYSEDVIRAVFDEWRHREIMRISDEILGL